MSADADITDDTVLESVKVFNRAVDAAHTHLPDAHRTAVAAALAAAGDVFDRAEQESVDLRQDAGLEAHRLRIALDQVRAAGVDPELLRWCAWPGCWRSYSAATGPTDHGWISPRHLVLLCPTHGGAGHQPNFVWSTGETFITGLCECGATEQLQPTNRQAVTDWWKGHVQRDVTAAALPVDGDEIRALLPAAREAITQSLGDWVDLYHDDPDRTVYDAALVNIIRSVLVQTRTALP